ncbi:DNA primase [Caulobacter sp. D4A]|uniref:toprim domain-containing protein n=1 Tax=unclassified Caulobacter TaxID=2648921 RepID=UPI000D735D44|nr:MULTISPECIES: toprim domain-containing protein [unclassified Caulobacter]PXA91196.1 DNA primase [Caulobacter sp. D4A]PXA96783.1 DNA primase [Caulobacter sp. D5]
MDLLSGEIEAISPRGLTRDTCEKYGYRIGTYQGRKCHLAPYYDDLGALVAQKVRYKRDNEKAFTWAGDPKAAGLFGQRQARAGGKMIVVTEGEIDALSAAQALGLRWPVVSLPNGASAARRDLSKHTAFLESFEKIVLCFDMDKPGREAVEDVVGLFSPGKVFVAQLPLKDSSEMVMANRSAELVDALFGAKVYRPDGIRTVADLKQKALAPQAWGLPWPWRTLTQRTYGIQRRYIYAWGAGVGSGKTTTQKQLMLTAMRPDLLEDHGDLGIPIPPPRKVGTILFEENPAKTLRSLAGMAIGKRLNKPDVIVTDEEISAAIDTFDGLFFPIDCFGAKDWDSVKANIKYLVLSEGVRDIFIDPLTALVAGEEDERRALDAIMADMSGLVETYDFTIHLVSHLTTPQGTAHEEGGRVLEKHFTGSRAIARWSHAMIGLERNKQEPDSPTTLRGLKDREHGEAVGPLLGLTFNRETGRMIECSLDGDNDCPFSTETSDDL